MDLAAGDYVDIDDENFNKFGLFSIIYVQKT